MKDYSLPSLCESSHNAGKRDDNEPYPSMKLKVGKAEVIAPILSNLNDEQFSTYMDTLQELLKPILDNEMQKNIEYDCFIVEFDDKTSYLSIKTIAQYGTERATEQRKAREEIYD